MISASSSGRSVGCSVASCSSFQHQMKPEVTAIYHESSTAHPVKEFATIRNDGLVNFPHKVLATDGEVREFSRLGIAASVG